MKNRYYSRDRKKIKSKSYIPKIRPGSDAKLKRVFSRIGVPEEKPFEPDPFQIRAAETIRNADCLVTAPTGAGKTWIAEQAIDNVIKHGGKTWYGTPLKALSNTIYAKFVKKFGSESVGILTGDKKENSDADIIVGTTEILRNHLYDAMHRGEDLDTDLVILDEAHYLGDEERGVVWEEIMIYLPSRIPLLLLSATIGNAEQISGWLESIRQNPCVIVEEKERPVPLFPMFFHPAGTLFPLLDKSNKKGKRGLYKKVISFLDNPNAPTMSRGSKLPPMGDILKVLKRYNLLPAIFFMKSRADCDAAIEMCTGEILAEDPQRREHLSERIGEIVKDNPHLARHRQRWVLENLAVGSHHSGQLPAWKVVVETLMAEGLLDAMFATSTVAAGVDFPARTVVVLNSDRYNGTEFVSLSSTQLQQMTGRAGRRGKDNIGFAVTIPGRFMNLPMISKLFNAPPGHVTSQIRIDFTMVLNLLLSHSPKEIREILSKSFASYLISNAEKKKKKLFGGFTGDMDYLWRDFQQHLSFLIEEDFVEEDGTLTEDGIWTSHLRIDSPLLVSEGFRLGIFPTKDPALLTGIISSFVNERESDDDYLDKSRIDPELIDSYLRVKRILKPFAKKMMRRGFEVKPLCLLPAMTLHAWASGAPWEKVVRLSGQAEGDLARLVLRTADNLRHLKNLKEFFPEVAKTANQGIGLIMREPVVSFYD